MKGNNLGGLRYLVFNEIFMLFHILIIKIIAGDFPAIQIVFIRCLTSSIVLLPILIKQKRLSELRQSFRLNALRVGFTTAAITINFFTISQIQLAQVSTISYLRPAVVSLVAWCFLGERQTWPRWGVIIVAFTAIWLIFSPESSFLQLVALLAILGVFCGSAATILQKHLSVSMGDLPLMGWYSIGIAITSLPFALVMWKTPTSQAWVLMMMTGLLATAAQLFFIRAFRKSEASFLAPMFYFHIIPITAIGFFIFDEVPSRNTVIGALVILASLVGMTVLENRRQKPKAK
ncbi:DMT family transporter [Alphaproteobacteria bacterium]|jgi:drug/metabolite transporter (DMT)-like permease|nr:DMT family transporter [Alphaproteobacteria bacterium]